MGSITLNRLILLFSIIGMVISGQLWLSHSTGFALPCTGSGCDQVANSRYAYFFGFPVAAFGFFYFGTLVMMALSRLQAPEQWQTMNRFIVGLSTLGLLAFIYFTYVQFAVIKVSSPCWWCLGAAVSNLLAWLFALAGLRSAPEGSISTNRELRYGVALALVALLAGGGFAYWRSNSVTQTKVETVNESKRDLLLRKGDVWKSGNTNAPLIVIEFSDFQCPACKQAYQLVEDSLMKEHGDKVMFVFRHYPLIQIHPMAWVAASATEEAGKAGKFWEMYNSAFKMQELTIPTLIAEAKKLGLDEAKMKNALENKEVHFDRIFRDYEDGSKLGVNSTPTFFVLYNDELHFAPGTGGLMRVLNENPAISAYLGKPVKMPESATTK
ncbi:MAG: vitamin K epoxide reductase family protein [Fimbriimonadia bacterium]|nr:vitamin K epoxide reductase family protein [Fimbriimonadia bacterium]